jgi:DNA-binding response OmpR family regulator
MGGEVVPVVDDEPRIVKTSRAYLENAGLRVVTASGGHLALTVYHHAQPALVVLGPGLPRLDGLGVGRTMRRELNLPTIMLIARVDEAGGLTGLELDADD